MEDRIERIKQHLHSHNYKLTPQREATVRVLLEHEDDHLSAEDVYLLVKEKAPEIGLATVYRTLELLSDLKIIHKLNFGDGVARYEFREEGAERHHHHLICVQCGAVDEIMEDLLQNVEHKVEEDFQFKILDHRLIFHGICHRCQQENNQPLPEAEQTKPAKAKG
ncbi:Fur family ferric uptake transcriptional regulator [Caldalkalibacillus uzonensis]|uniref:Fur family ferric uptake transcriptional regulator n=1 Tax=Caldalkalibacillus uzonensis TaxID=353224 RepID=A0ABU0CTE9_9BACI|nr:Fur family transcriptional regulator [Caldalkalibacillus uzonensis]MDQ0339154.1 Fur family ferric uptake transcriptional regulator [Caldalkalibacillus uzonensis]